MGILVDAWRVLHSSTQELKVTGILVYKHAFPVELWQSREDREEWRERVQIKLHFPNWLFCLKFLFLFYKNLSIQYFFLCVWLIHAVFLISAPISTTLCLSFNAEKEDRTQRESLRWKQVLSHKICCLMQVMCLLRFAQLHWLTICSTRRGSWLRLPSLVS